MISNESFDVFIDSYNNVWVSSLGGGVSRLNENIFLLHPIQKHNTNIFSLAKQLNSSITWMFTCGFGLWKTTDTERVMYTIQPNKLISHFHYITNGCIINENELWLSTYGSGVAHFKNEKVTFYTLSPIGDDNILYSTARSKDGKIWFASQQFGIIYYEESSKKFYRIHKGSGALSNRLININYFQDKVAFLYETGGMQMVTDESLLDFYINDQFYDKSISHILTTKKGTTIISTSNDGLLLVDKKQQLYQLSTKEGLLSNTIYNTFEGEDGKIWIFTDKGVERIILSGLTVTFDKTIYNSEAAFVNELISYKFSDKNSHFNVLSKNPYYYDPENEKPSEEKPIINIKNIFLNNKELQTKVAELSFQSKDELKVNYNFIFWGQENKYEHHAMLINDKNDTTQFQIGKKGEVSLKYLEPNIYKFCITFQTSHKTFKTKTLVFEVLPHWYNRWWFRATLFLVVFALFYFLFTQKQLQNAYLQEKINEQTQLIKNEKIELEKKNDIIETQYK